MEHHDFTSKFMNSESTTRELATLFYTAPLLGSYPRLKRFTRRFFRYGAAKALGIHPRPIETAGASLPFGEHIAAILDPLQARLFPLRGLDPLDPIPARDGSDVRPYRPHLRLGGRERLPQISRHLGFRFLGHWRDFQRDVVARLRARRFAQLPVHFEPVASLAVRLECGPKGMAIDEAFHCRHTPCGELRTSALWQDKKGPRPSLRRLRGSQESCFETDIRGGLHFSSVYSDWRRIEIGREACRCR